MEPKIRAFTLYHLNLICLCLGKWSGPSYKTNNDKNVSFWRENLSIQRHRHTYILLHQLFSVILTKLIMSTWRSLNVFLWSNQYNNSMNISMDLFVGFYRLWLTWIKLCNVQYIYTVCSTKWWSNKQCNLTKLSSRNDWIRIIRINVVQMES